MKNNFPDATPKSGREYWVDFTRVIAVLLVMFAHLINVASNDPQSLRSIFGEVTLPAYPTHSALTILEWPLLYIKTSAGAVGVSLFFLASGYLMHGMSHRYQPYKFLLNRAFRIYPLLIVYAIVIFSIDCFASKTRSAGAYFSNALLVNLFFGIPSLIGITWTLNMESYFYVLTAVEKSGRQEGLFWYVPLSYL